ncbi:MAG: ABC transporter substrate-binding protein [Paracoccaceae bacterium]|nr:MAG: ABC transporter substrate-binding protein [Paracoccaceae bacterium]
MITRRATLALLAAAALPRAATALAEPEVLRAEVEAGRLPPMAARLPKNPRVMPLAAMGRQTGQPGGTIRMLVGGQRDVRLMPFYGYARLVGYDDRLNLVPDILQAVEVEDGRAFTFRLREGHRWSDGEPMTASDFQYVWEDMITNRDLYRGGPPTELMQGDTPPRFEVRDALTVRYSWPAPMPDFLSKLASPAPVILVAPAHYLRQFHARYNDEASLADLIKKNRVDDWQGLHTKMGRQNRPENPELPTLEPWRPRTAPPAERFVFERNPYFHRVDETGQQLPYVDRVELNVASSEVMVAKTATGETDLQGAWLTFADYTHLKHAEDRYPLKVSLWRHSKGSAVALYPNLTCGDAGWRPLFRDIRVRRAMSVAIDREEINKVLFYGLGRESADTVLPESPLYREEYARAWSQHDPALANALLDEAGLDARGPGGIRKLADGRQAGIVVETAGESALETDVLELVRDHFREIGIAIYIRTSQRDIFRSRALAGQVVMSVWQGIENAVPTADMSPDSLAPTNGEQYQWPIWGQHYFSASTSGTKPDMDAPLTLLGDLAEWRRSTDAAAREAIWHRMLRLRAEQVFTIGTVNGALQPVVHSARLRNVPDKALWGFEPTSYFGAYSPDTFFYGDGA